MRVRFLKAFYWLTAVVSFFCVAPAANAQSDLSTVKSRMLADAVDKAGFRVQTEGYSGTDLSKADAYASSIASNGSWSGIDYGDTSNNFPALDHLDHILVMAYSYNQKADTAHYKSATLLAAMNKALGYWYQVNPKCSNWFKNDIAKQFFLGPIGLMMQGAIDAGYLNKVVSDLTDAPSMTGANKTALSTSVVYRAVIEGSTSRLSSGVSGVASVIAVTSGDGIQRDFSFQQHGGILYNGNYGWGFLRDVTWVGTMISGTQYAFSAAQLGLLRDNYLQGTRWMIRNGVLDYNVRGREVGNSGGSHLKADDFLNVLDHFLVIDPTNASAYQTSQDAIKNQMPQDVSGVRHYWNSDYTAVQRGAYFASMKMCSKRTIGMERNVNTENLLGYWLPYGLTYTYQRGDEYNYVFPIWDWARLPGVTSPHVEISITDNSTTYTSQSTSFVGGASDGSYGASAMDFSFEQTKAKKAWFWFDREWVALGAGIESTHSKPIFTSVQQVLQKGTVVADGTVFSGAAKALTNPQWVLHDGVGYVFPEAQTVQIQAALQTGSVKRIFGLGSSATVSGNVFSLWFDHGTAPKGKAYQYVVVPGIDQVALAQYAQTPPIKVLSNTPALQAVTQLKRRATGAVFFQAGSVSVPDGPAVKVDAPCIVVLNEPAGSVAVSDPNATLSKVTVTVTNVGGAAKSQTVTLPGGDSAGKSVIVTNLLDKRAALDDGTAGSGGSAGAPAQGMAGDSAMAGNGQGGTSTSGSGGIGGATDIAGTPGIAGDPGLAGYPGTGGAALPGMGGAMATQGAPADSGGCGCSVARKSTRGAPWALLGFALFAVARRRRSTARAVS